MASFSSKLTDLKNLKSCVEDLFKMLHDIWFSFCEIHYQQEDRCICFYNNKERTIVQREETDRKREITKPKFLRENSENYGLVNQNSKRYFKTKF